jgi:hypothetical protein
MKFTEPRPYANPEAAAHKIVENCSRERGRQLRRAYAGCLVRLLGCSTCPQRRHSKVWHSRSKLKPFATTIFIVQSGHSNLIGNADIIITARIN